MDKQLNFNCIPEWPKLAWVAQYEFGSPTIIVHHGPYVETNQYWCIEGVWPGNFEEGNFDQTAIMIGTGVRIRGPDIVFVSSGDVLSRILYFKEINKIYVSNSLPALLAVTNQALLMDYNYVKIMSSIKHGIESYIQKIPTDRSYINQLYTTNLYISDYDIKEITKTSLAPDFNCFSIYRDFLYETSRLIGENASSTLRKHKITPLATVSSGYDSSVAALLSREAGAKHTVTISNARRGPDNFFNLNMNDSGDEIAKQLGMSCTIYSRNQNEYTYEDCIWAIMGNIIDINLTVFDYPSPLCLLFTGFYGDGMWGNKEIQPEPLQYRHTTSGVCFSECRLELGIFNCAPAFWGYQKEGQIIALRYSQEMTPWLHVSKKYNRPVPRRLLEEAGVSRNSFGMTKYATTFSRRYGRPLSVSLREDFNNFMNNQGTHATSGIAENISLSLRAIEQLFLNKLPKPLQIPCGEWIRLPSSNMFLLWANERRKQRYLDFL